MQMITWTNETRKLGELEPWEDNPRYLDSDDQAWLDQSLQEFGYAEPILIGPNNQVYNGHQRLKVLLVRHGANYEVDVRMSSRPLTLDEQKKLTVFFHESATGQWDFDVIGTVFDSDDLVDWGFPSYMIPDRFTPPTLDELGEQYGEPEEDAFWPVIRIKVSPEVYSRWTLMMADMPGLTDMERIDSVLEKVSHALTSGSVAS